MSPANMMLSKELQEILEGVHYFLSESLPGEALSGKLECLRRGLVMQLEALALSYPTLRIRARSSASLPYLAMDQGPIHALKHRSESMSSGSSGSNSYSNSSSGDGMVLGRGGGGNEVPDNSQQQQQQQQQHQQRQHQQLQELPTLIQDEEYEDFDDAGSKDDTISVQESLHDTTRDDNDERDDPEDVYMETVTPLPFASALATCDRHGILSKRTKGLLRNLKNYHCVATAGMLYLYSKETDERQRKTIDLSGYVAREATGEEVKDQRKRDSAFEIVGPGKKTHTFIARTPRDKAEWLGALDRTIKVGRSRSQSSIALDTPYEEQHSVKPPPIPTSLPPPLTKVSSLSTQQLARKEEPKPEVYYYHDVAADDRDEVYEEVGPESAIGRVIAERQSKTLPPRTQPPSWATDLPDYDPVSPEDVPPPLPDGPPPSTPGSARRGPARPPLPAFLKDRINKQASRPLPDAPAEQNDGVEDPGIYCEIEEDLDGLEEAYEKRLAEENEKNWNLSARSSTGSNLSINKPRAVSSEGVPSSDTQSLASRMSSTSLVGSFSDEIFMNFSENSSHTPHKFSLRSSTPRTPPKLPPKGIPYPQAPEDDCEYKVPTCTVMDAEYQIPNSNLVAADVEETTKKDQTLDASGSVPASETYQVPPSTQIRVPIKPKISETKASTTDGQTKPATSFISNKEDTNVKNNMKLLTRRFELRGSHLGSEEQKDKRQQPNQGTSVKDMIARLNQKKTESEPTDTKVAKTKEDSISTGSSSNTPQKENCSTNTPEKENSLTTADEHKQVKPALPPRPLNLSNGATIVVKPKTNSEDTRNCDSAIGSTSDDDYYETPEDNSFESTSQRNSREISQEREDMTGDYYIAKFAYVASADNGLSFNRGDQLLIHNATSSNGLWRATSKGKSGLVPREYLKKKQ